MLDNYILNTNEVHIWIIKIPFVYFNIDFYSSVSSDFKLNLKHFSFLKDFNKLLINEKDIKKGLSFYQTKDQISSLISKYSLRFLLNNYLNLNFKNYDFEFNKYSKPFIPNFINALNLQYNLSHSGEYLLISLNCYDNIGIDIEFMNKKIEIECLKDQFFSKYELDIWKTLKEDEKIEYFYKVWACKESILKGIGMGFSYLPSNISFEFSPDNNGKIIQSSVCHEESDFDQWKTKLFKIDNNYQSAFSVRKNTFHVKYINWDWDKILI